MLFNGTPRLLPRNMRETLFLPFLVSTVVKLFICFAGSHSRLLMADIALLVYVAGWATLGMFRNLTYDKDFKENNLPRFPFPPAIAVNQWFRQAVESSVHTSGRIINMLNLQNTEPNEYLKLKEAVSPPREEDAEGFTMLYHGTRAHEHAVSILEGIQLSRSEGEGDFSHLKGFYVTRNFERAENKYAGLGKKNCAIKAAVLAFKIPDDVLDSFRESYLDLMGEDNKARWVDTVKNIKDESKKYNFIEGPEMERVPDTDEKTYKQLPDTHQMCILDKRMAKAFDVHLHAVVFYDIPGVEATERKP